MILSFVVSGGLSVNPARLKPSYGAHRADLRAPRTAAQQPRPMVLNSRRCIADDVSSVRSTSTTSRTSYSDYDSVNGSERPGLAESGGSSRGSRPGSAASGGSSKSRRRRRRRRSEALSSSSPPPERSGGRPGSGGRQVRSMAKGTRPSAKAFVAKSEARPGSAGSKGRSGKDLSLRIVDPEQIRAKRRRARDKTDVVRKRAAVALIGFHWRCYWRGLERRQQSAATLLQRMMRGRHARRDLLLRLSVVTVQFHARRFLRRMAKIRAELLSVATLRLQRAFLARQQRRCKQLQRLASDCVVAAQERESRMESEAWLAAQQKQRTAERKQSEAVQEALTKELEVKAARKAYGGADHGKEELHELKARMAREEAAVSLIRRVFLRRTMHRRVRVLVHEQRQAKIAELATDVTNLIDAALTVADAASDSAGAGARAGRKPPKARAGSAPPMPSFRDTHNPVVTRQRPHSAAAVHEYQSGGQTSMRSRSRRGAHSAPPNRSLALLGYGDEYDDDDSHWDHGRAAKAQLRASQIYGGRISDGSPEKPEWDSDTRPLAAIHSIGEGSLYAFNRSGRGRSRRAEQQVGAAGRIIKQEMRLTALHQRQPNRMQLRPGSLAEGTDGTPESWLPTVRRPSSGGRKYRPSHRERASLRPQSAAY